MMAFRKLREKIEGLNLPSQTQQGGSYKVRGPVSSGMTLESLAASVWTPVIPGAL